MRGFVSLVLLVLALVSCGRETESGGGGPKPTGGPRIISLSPAISRTLVDFELHKHIVGRTPHCASIDQSIPVVGDLINVDYEAAIRLRPTHVLVQPPSGGIDQRLIELSKERDWTIGQWRLNGREDIEAMVRDLPGVLFEGDASREADATRQAARILNDIAAALSPVAGDAEPLFRGRVLIVHAVDPAVLVSGAGTYLDDILRTLGAANAANAQGWAKLTLEDVVRLDPEAIILVRPGRPANPAPLADLAIAAVRDKRIAVASDQDGEMPSSGIINVAREFQSILRDFAASGPSPPQEAQP